MGRATFWAGSAESDTGIAHTHSQAVTDRGPQTLALLFSTRAGYTGQQINALQSLTDPGTRVLPRRCDAERASSRQEQRCRRSVRWSPCPTGRKSLPWLLEHTRSVLHVDQSARTRGTLVPTRSVRAGPMQVTTAVASWADIPLEV